MQASKGHSLVLLKPCTVHSSILHEAAKDFLTATRLQAMSAPARELCVIANTI